MPINTDFWLKWMPDKYISASLWFQMMENSTDYNQKSSSFECCGTNEIEKVTSYYILDKLVWTRGMFFFGYHFRLFFKYWSSFAKIQSWQRNHDFNKYGYNSPRIKNTINWTFQ